MPLTSASATVTVATRVATPSDLASVPSRSRTPPTSHNTACFAASCATTRTAETERAFAVTSAYATAAPTAAAAT